MTDATLPVDRAAARAIRPAGTIWFLASAVLALMTIAPLLWMLSIAFKGPEAVFEPGLIPSRPTLENFLYVFTEVDFLRFLLNTLLVAGSVTVIALLFHSMAGYALARLRFPGRDAI